MKVFNLPADIHKGENAALDKIIVHEFRSTTNTVKERSIMSKNAISLVIKGCKKMYFAESTVNASDEEIHFLSAGNCIASIEFLTQDEFHSILIFFDADELADFFVKNKDIIQRYQAKGNTNDMPYIAVKKDAFIRHYISSLQLMLHTGTPISKQMKALKFEELMLYLVEKYPESILSFQYTQKKTGVDIEIRTVVETNIGNNLSVDELAFLCNLSPSTFKRHFQKIYHTTPNNWFLQQRMMMAAKLLRHGKEKPAEVFHKIGYENHSSFSKSFKKFYGMSPKEFQMSDMTV